MPQQRYIEIQGARVNNLKNISVQIPENAFTVITGLSGSGKSSLAFDTLYAEGQRRYVESLSAYARQFLGRMNKPEVDFIKNIPPAIAIEQKVNTRNPRSTVGTSTEIYEYLRLLFARIGKTYSPLSGEEVKKHRTKDVIEYVLKFPEGSRFLVLCPLNQPKGRSLEDHLESFIKQGFSRISPLSSPKEPQLSVVSLQILFKAT
jgi:excinuclease ABC subunit A